MAKKIRFVIDDADRAHQANIRSHLVGALKAGASVMRAQSHAVHAAGNPKSKGETWGFGDGFACPDGLPNCRNCGDPEFFDSCKAAGHCQLCGRGSHLGPGFKGGHGVAPDSVLIAHGLRVEEFDEE